MATIVGNTCRQEELSVKEELRTTFCVSKEFLSEWRQKLTETQPSLMHRGRNYGKSVKLAELQLFYEVKTRRELMQSSEKSINEQTGFEEISKKIKVQGDTCMVKITRMPPLMAEVKLVNARTRVVITTTCANNDESIMSKVKKCANQSRWGRGAKHPIAIANKDSNNKRNRRGRR